MTRRRGSAYAIVLIMSGLVSAIALGGLALRRSTVERAVLLDNAAAARNLARSAAELGIARATRLAPDIELSSVAGTWVNDLPLGAGTLGVSAVSHDADADSVVSALLGLLGIEPDDPESGDISSKDLLTVVGQGRVGAARRRLAVTMARVPAPEYVDRALALSPTAHWTMRESPLSLAVRDSVSAADGYYSSLLVSGSVPARDGGLAPGLRSKLSYAVLPSSTVTPSQGTVALWLRRDAGSPDSAMILQFGNNDTPRLYLELKGKHAYVEVVDDLGHSGSVKADKLDLLETQWYHITATYGTDGLKVYVDGRAHDYDDAPVAGITVPAAVPILVGVYRSKPGAATNDSLGGTVREVSIFDRALSDREITALYGDGKHQSSDAQWIVVPGSWKPVVEN